MPFVQMENISHFLRACQAPPINLQPHDIFQTVDLYEAKDPTQVLQCITAFSRRARAVQPSKFATAIGVKSKVGALSPQSSGGYIGGGGGTFARARGISNTSENSSTTSNLQLRGTRGNDSPAMSFEPKTPTKSNGGLTPSSTGGVSSWSKRTDEGATTPAWNIHQYGYMGGASQGNQGITFGGRRQITTPAPKVPSLADKERRRREDAAEAERLQVLAEEAEHKRRVEREAEEERDRVAEEQRWIEESRQRKEREKADVEEEKRRWETEERKWKKEEESRVKAEKEAEARFEKERQRKREASDTRLKGQFLSQYQAEQRQLPSPPSAEDSERAADRARVKELERELEKAREREKQYEREKQERILQSARTKSTQNIEDNDLPLEVNEEPQIDNVMNRTRPLPSAPSHSHQGSDESWRANDEREFLHREWTSHNNSSPPKGESPTPPPQPPRPLPIPQSSTFTAPPSPPPPSLPARPLPNPQTYIPPSSPRPSFPSRPSSLLSREMELDRLRQQEWEEAQKATRAMASSAANGGGFGMDGASESREGTRPGGGAWDVNQYGYLGGDNQNRGGPGLGVGRRQIIGPRVEMRRGGG